MSAKLGIILGLLALLLVFILCPWMHWGSIAGINGVATNVAATNPNTKVNVDLAASALKVAYEDGKYHLTGTVPDDATKQQFINKANEVYGAGNYIDQIKIGDVAKPTWLASALALFPFTKNGVTAGGLTAEGNSLSLIGQVPTQADKDKIYKDALVACPPNTTINNLLTISGAKPLSEDQSKVQVQLNEAVAGKIIEFETGSDRLTAKGREVLDELAPILKDSTENLEIAGNTDNQGNAAANQALSERRAVTVKKFLTVKGLDANRFTTKGFGQDKPIADNNTEEGRRHNRRIEFQVTGGK